MHSLIERFRVQGSKVQEEQVQGSKVKGFRGLEKKEYRKMNVPPEADRSNVFCPS